MMLVSTHAHFYALLRTLCVAIVAACVMLATTAAQSQVGPTLLGAGGEATVQQDQARSALEARSGGSCTISGLCWILPVRADGMPARLAMAGRYLLLRSAQAEAKWHSGPPDQPPRVKG